MLLNYSCLFLHVLGSKCVLEKSLGELLDRRADGEGEGGGPVAQTLVREPQAALQQKQ